MAAGCGTLAMENIHSLSETCETVQRKNYSCAEVFQLSFFKFLFVHCDFP